MLKKEKPVPLSKALIFSFLSVILTTGTLLLGYTYYEFQLSQKEQSDRYFLRALSLQSSGEDKLPARWFEEVLNLSVDRPTNLLQLDLKEIKALLLSYPFFKTVEVKVIKPSILEIDYTLRTPRFELGNRANLAIDEEGVLFPLEPIYAKRLLPQIWLKEEKIDGDKLAVALSIERIFLEKNKRLKSIDLARIDSPSLGFREVILEVGEEGELLRLAPDAIEEGLSHYFLLGETASIIDLRFAGIAIIQ